MARLIDADALGAEFPVIGEFGKDLWHSATIRAVIKNAPTVDAVEVVRCGECWAYNQPDCPMSGSPGRVSVSDFCSYGERKANGC